MEPSFFRKPEHVAIITDGNGRWATQRGQPRFRGHDAGVKALDRIIEACLDWEIPYLSVFAFSQENWKRPPEEIGNIFTIIRHYLDRRLKTALEKDIRIKVIGTLDRLSPALAASIKQAERATAHCKSLTLVVALNYSGRWDIVQAANKILAEYEQESYPVIDEEMLANHLITKDIPNPGLLIRTAGEYRLSNFFLWQSAYAELFFSPLPWPDFDRRHLLEAIRSYEIRQRTFGDVPPQPGPRAVNNR